MVSKAKKRKIKPYFGDEIPGVYEFCFGCFFKHDPKKDCADKSGWKRPEIPCCADAPRR